MAKRNKKAPAPADIRIVVDPDDSAPAFYVNYMEVANTANDFTLFGARLPAKVSEETKARIVTSNEFHVDADVLITFPVSLVPGLIRALTTQKEHYEKMTGAAIQEPGVAK
jgi:hypothetical protein